MAQDYIHIMYSECGSDDMIYVLLGYYNCA